MITKTASPDLPGEFAGGVVQINTKSVPDKNFQSITVGSGYNSITTFKNNSCRELSSYVGSSVLKFMVFSLVSQLPIKRSIFLSII